MIVYTANGVEYCSLVRPKHPKNSRVVSRSRVLADFSDQEHEFLRTLF